MADSVVHCSNCMEEIVGIDRQKMCSVCKSRIYCSKACQRKDWKAGGHKLLCPVLASMRQAQGKRQSRLCLQWLQNPEPNTQVRWIVGKALSKEQVLQQPSPFYVMFNVAFDYNWETFVPTFPPLVVRKENIPFLEVPNAPASPGEYKHMALINFEGVLHVRLVTFHQRAIDWNTRNNTWFAEDASWDELRDTIIADCRLTSSLFARFPQIRDENLSKQLAVIQTSDPYKTFVPCALHMQTKKPLFLTHVVVVQFEFGLGLGQITRLVDYKVVPVKDLLEDMKNSGNFSPEMLAKYQKEELNLSLLQDRRPNEDMMRIMFWNTNLAQKYAFICVRCSPMPKCPPNTIVPPHMVNALDLKARQDLSKCKHLTFLRLNRPPSIDGTKHHL